MSRWGGSSSRAGCWQWFPADTWNSSVAQSKDPWWRIKRSLLFPGDYKMQPPPYPTTSSHHTYFTGLAFEEFSALGGFKWEHASNSLNTHQEPNTRKICVWEINQSQTSKCCPMQTFLLLINTTFVYFISKMQKTNPTFLKLHVKLELVRLEVKWLTQLSIFIGGSYVRGTGQLSKQLTINVFTEFLEPVTKSFLHG